MCDAAFVRALQCGRDLPPRLQRFADRKRTAIQSLRERFAFHELENERDPICGNQDGTLEYKIPKRPIRRKITGLPAFTTLRGGAYFFLPGLAGLRYLASLR